MVRQFYDGYGEHFRYDDARETKCRKDDKKSSDCNLPVKKEDCELINKEKTDKGILSHLGADDIILIGVLIFLLYDGVDDYILLIIIGIIFILGITDGKENQPLFDK